MRQGKLTPSERAETECELRRLVAHERWEWMPGMLFEPRDVDRATIDEWPEAYRARVTNRGLGRPDAWIPIPSDPATAGCLLEMYLRRGGWLSDLASATPTRKEFASLGDFLVAQLLAGDDR
jgi:hypothetical protein